MGNTVPTTSFVLLLKVLAKDVGVEEAAGAGVGRGAAAVAVALNWPSSAFFSPANASGCPRSCVKVAE
jgi:hypothetical protein